MIWHDGIDDLSYIIQVVTSWCMYGPLLKVQLLVSYIKQNPSTKLKGAKGIWDYQRFAKCICKYKTRNMPGLSMYGLINLPYD